MASDRLSEDAAGNGSDTLRTAQVELHPFKSEVCDVPADLEIDPGKMVVIRDEEGEDLGRLVGYLDGEESRGVVVREATADDMEEWRELVTKTKRVLDLFRRLKDEFGLRMKVVDAHWRWDRKKVCFYFISEERLDFRALHKVISSALNVRVAIKQIGVRDHARMVGGLGPCGRELCCKGFMRELRPIALRMARQQNLFVEPSKISGLCGKLLCCLRFEEETYRQAMAEMPRIGSQIRTSRGTGQVTGIDVMRRTVSVRYEDAVEYVVSLEDVGREE
ncbi:MAG: stage 0 sporulation protein [candidate division WOR-3 bacterium]|nr:MAG: stage 0 sporulation protein [candidate division WOR-3 bacterium]